ncbi:MAG: hypothetical protein LBT53_10210 [Puniceicoccales bacterium]|nr:hypothetical protein [Puniceicoccales bacterium]
MAKAGLAGLKNAVRRTLRYRQKVLQVLPPAPAPTPLANTRLAKITQWLRKITQ